MYVCDRFSGTNTGLVSIYVKIIYCEHFFVFFIFNLSVLFIPLHYFLITISILSYSVSSIYTSLTISPFVGLIPTFLMFLYPVDKYCLITNHLIRDTVISVRNIVNIPWTFLISSPGILFYDPDHEVHSATPLLWEETTPPVAADV